jgi:hypothetical protein
MAQVYIGIDWSEAKHDVCLTNPAGALLARLTIAHSPPGLAQLEALREKMQVPAAECDVALETAHNLLIEQIARQSGKRFAMTAGSDAHTLRRIGRTWTTAPGHTREEFLQNLRLGLGLPGGFHGTTAAIAGDAYGVVARYVAALVGFGPRDLGTAKRAACLGFTVVSLPFQFIPFVLAVRSKAGEQRAVELFHGENHLSLNGESSAA